MALYGTSLTRQKVSKERNFRIFRQRLGAVTEYQKTTLSEPFDNPVSEWTNISPAQLTMQVQPVPPAGPLEQRLRAGRAPRLLRDGGDKADDRDPQELPPTRRLQRSGSQDQSSRTDRGQRDGEACLQREEDREESPAAGR